MSLLILLAAQALGPEITTSHPMPSEEEREKELRRVQGLPPLPEPVKPPPAEPPKEAQAAPEKPPATQIEVVSVRTVAPDAKVIFVPPPPEGQPK